MSKMQKGFGSARWESDFCGCVMDLTWPHADPNDIRATTVFKCPMHARSPDGKPHLKTCGDDGRYRSWVIELMDWLTGDLEFDAAKIRYDADGNLTAVLGLEPEAASLVEQGVNRLLTGRQLRVI